MKGAFLQVVILKMVTTKLMHRQGRGRRPLALHGTLTTGKCQRRVCLSCGAQGSNIQDEEGDTPLMIAVMTAGNERLTKLLLVAGACVGRTNAIGETALMIALSNAEN